jgi:hypothetical protein
MRNNAVDISRNDLDALITSFVSEEDRWSQAVREEVKYKMNNPSTG